MANKKNKVTLIGIVTLTVLAGGMFSYQNIYMPKQQQVNTEKVYLANQDIQAYTEINPKMFDEVQISKSADMNMYVDDINSVKGQKLKGGLLKGEPLNKVRLTKEDITTNETDTPIEADYIGTINNGDFVNVYVLLTDKTEDSSVKKILSGKKVILTANKEDEKSIGFSLSLSEKELSDYYVAKSKGSIIVTKINNLDITNISSDTIDLEKAEAFDANSEEVKNAVKETNNGSDMAISYYVVQDGDTLDSLSVKFKTTTEKIIQLNNGKTEFKVNEQIAVPAI